MSIEHSTNYYLSRFELVQNLYSSVQAILPDRAVEPEPIAGAQAILDGRIQKFRFRFHSLNLWGKQVVEKIIFSFQRTKTFRSRRQKLIDVGTRTGAKHYR